MYESRIFMFVCREGRGQNSRFTDLCTLLCAYICVLYVILLLLVRVFPQPGQKVKIPSPDSLPPKKGGHFCAQYKGTLCQCWWICMSMFVQ